MINSNIINKMSIKEKASLCVGEDYWNSKKIERFDIPNIKMSDGPHGLRVQRESTDNLGINESKVSVCFPALSTIGNSWNKELAYLLGKTLGEEAKEEKVNIILGPAVNIKRSPLCGRNFEYISEDPFLAGTIGSEYVKGLQSQNVGACVKHFAVNNQENRRRTINAIVDERTLREIYLKPFEIIVKSSNPWAIMSAYNKVNGEYCTENEHLLKDILRKEWNYNGIIISDWGAENNRVKGLRATQELEMPGGRGNGVNEIIDAVKNSKITEIELNNAVDRIIEIAKKSQSNSGKIKKYNREKHHNIALKIAEDSIVLLKNNDNILPLNKNKNIAIIGDMAKFPRYQGAGSSTINPYKIENALDSFLEDNIKFEYAKGSERINLKNDKKLLEEAIKIAEKNEIVIVFAGLTENYESEGIDRKNIDIPINQNKLIQEICKVNKNVIVVLSNGSPIAMPWKDNVKAIITGYLGGEAGGRAIVNCLVGKVNPSGKLSESYPKDLSDTPCYNYYPGTELISEYKESIYVGYRYYDKVNKEVLFPFGFGLSYTQFEYSNLKVNKDDKIEIKFKIKNIGKVTGKEIAQIYISQIGPKIYKPNKELKEFVKIELKPNEEKEVIVKLNRESFEYYNTEEKSWKIEEGTYQIQIGKSSRDIVLKQEIYIDSKDNKIVKSYSQKYYEGSIQSISDEEFEHLLGYKLPEKHLNIENVTDENTLEQIKNTKVGKIIYENQIEKMNNLLKKQNTNKATKVMMDMQKPLKKFYEKKNSKITKDMIEELLDIAKNDKDYKNCKFLKEYLK